MFSHFCGHPLKLALPCAFMLYIKILLNVLKGIALELGCSFGLNVTKAITAVMVGFNMLVHPKYSLSDAYRVSKLCPPSPQTRPDVQCRRTLRPGTSGLSSGTAAVCTCCAQAAA